MIAKPLTAGLMLGAGLLVAASSVCADDTIQLKRVKDDTAAQQLQRDTGDDVTVDAAYRRGGRVGVYVGFRGGYVGYRGGYYYPRYYYPRVVVGGVYSPSVYYVAPPVYYYPSYYTAPSVSISTYYPISGTTPPGSSPNFRLKVDTPPDTGSPAGGETLPAPRPQRPGETLPAPRPERSGQQTFPYDGTPQVPVPMPRPDGAAQPKPPADGAEEGKIVSLPAKDKLAYPAFGDKPLRSTGDRVVVIKNDGTK